MVYLFIISFTLRYILDTDDLHENICKRTYMHVNYIYRIQRWTYSSTFRENIGRIIGKNVECQMGHY